MPSKSLYLRYRSEIKDTAGKPQEIIRMRKFNADADPLEEYIISHDFEKRLICNCPAAKSDCRHKKMLPIFDKAESGKDPLFDKVSDGNKYITYLAFDGRLFNWVRGPEKVEA